MSFNILKDEELERIKQKKLHEMIQKQNEMQEQTKIEVIELTSENFDRTISTNSLTLVDFWAEWCGPCRIMHPVFERLAKKYKKIRFARVNVDNNQPIAQKFGVQSIPTFIMFQNGQEAKRMMGAVGEPGIHLIVKKFLELEN